MGEIRPLAWVKSSYSGGGGECVEVADLPGGQLGVRDSKNPSQGHLTFSQGVWATFVGAVKTGTFI